MSNPPRDITQLIRGCVDGSPTPDDVAALRALLRDSEEARELYVDYLRLHAMLEFPQLQAPSATTRGEPSDREPHLRITPIVWSIAAALLLSAAAVAVYLFVFSDPTSEIRDPKSLSPVATLIEADGGQITTPHDFAVAGGTYGPGEYTLSSGTAEFMLTNSVNVKLRGDTRLVMHNDMSVALTRGSVSFSVPHGATGFTVRLPNGTHVVDLGTEFQVDVDENGRGLVLVLDGRVRLDSPGLQSTELQLGEARVIDAGGPHVPVAEDLAYARWVVAMHRFRQDDSLAIAVLADDLDPSQSRKNLETAPGRFERSRSLRFGHDDSRVEFDGPGKVESFTYAAWIHPDRLGEFRALVMTDDWMPGSVHWQIYEERLNLSFFEDLNIYADRPIVPGRWQHVAAVYDGVAGRVRLYIDGERVADEEARPASTPEIKGATVGNWRPGKFDTTRSFDRAFSGRLDELLIIPHALSDDEINSHYEIGRVPRADAPSKTNDPVSTDAPDRVSQRTDGRSPAPVTSEIANR